jgi:hypothetical protein
MASAFDKLTPIIDQGPNALPQRYGSTRWLLWPLWAWPVAVPAVRWRGLNLFQHTILALAARGVHRAVDVGRRLDLGKELAAHVLGQLMAMDYLTHQGAPTHRGKRYLEEHDDQSPEVIPGMVFHDALSGRLWLRFLPGAPRYVNLSGDRDVGGYAKIERGTTGAPKPKLCRVVWPDRSVRPPSAPSPQSIRRVCRTWARHHDAWLRVTGAGGLGWDGDAESLRRIGEGHISILASMPRPMFASTFLFLPEDCDDGSLWHVADPFGIGPSTALRQQVEDLVSDGSKVVAEEVAKLAKVATEVVADDVVDARNAMRRAAENEVSARLGTLECPEGLRPLLIQLEIARLAIANLKDRSGFGAWREQQRHHVKVVRRAWDALEELLSWLTATWARPELASRLGRQERDNASLLRRLALDLGFKDDDTQDSLARLLRVNGGQAKGVLQFDNRDLPAMVACALLGTTEQSAHPFHDAARDFPGLLVFLDALKRERDPLAHHGAAGEPSLPPDDIADQLYRACCVLLPGSGQMIEGRGRRSDLGWTVAVAHRLQARAVQAVERRYGRGIRDFPDLRRDLVELSRLVAELAAAEQGSDTAALRKDLALAGGRALEGVLGTLLDAVARPTWIAAHDEAELRDLAVALTEQLNLNSDGARAVLRASTMRVHRAATTGRGTAGSLAFALLLSAREDDQHPLRRIAESEPDFLVAIARLIDTRGHGDRAPSVSECQVYAAELDRVCHLVLEHTH